MPALIGPQHDGDDDRRQNEQHTGDGSRPAPARTRNLGWRGRISSHNSITQCRACSPKSGRGRVGSPSRRRQSSLTVGKSHPWRHKVLPGPSLATLPATTCLTNRHGICLHARRGELGPQRPSGPWSSGTAAGSPCACPAGIPDRFDLSGDLRPSGALACRSRCSRAGCGPRRRRGPSGPADPRSPPHTCVPAARAWSRPRPGR